MTAEEKLKELYKKIRAWRVIPKGLYCYSYKRGKRIVCPYWGMDKRTNERQECGYCFYLKKGDWDINEDHGDIQWKRGDGTDGIITKAHEMPMSLLWDMCKECGVKT